ncbi:MAG: response regulator [Deltaproteobacteria bacterium]|nr:response regulator [Deltaproteobacteria bacterium]
MGLIRFLIVSPEKDALQDLTNRLMLETDLEIHWADSGKEALDSVSHDPVDLVITDEELGDMTGLEFAERLVMLNPLINCAAVSSLSPADFHEASEGLGLLAQIPEKPTGSDAENLMEKFYKIRCLF